MKINVCVRVSEYGSELPTLSVTDYKGFAEGAKAVHAAAALVYQAAIEGEIDLRYWAVGCDALDHMRIWLEPVEGVDGRRFGKGCKLLDRVAAIMLGRGGYTSGRRGERLFVTIPEGR